MHSLVLESPGAILFQLGPLAVRWYGVMIALGFVAAATLASSLAKKRGIDSEQLLNLCLFCFIVGILGARLYFVALNFNFYSTHPEEIFATWLGGLSIHGGLIGGFLAGIAYAQYKHLPKLVCLDIIACVLPLAQAIGRFGNFFNSEAFGKPVPPDFPLALRIPLAQRPEAYQSEQFFHPTFLYESVWNLMVFAILYFWLGDRLKNYPGLCSLIYLAAYSCGRLLIEPLRTDSIMAGAMPVPVIASAVLLAVSIILMPLLYFGKKAG